VHWLLLAAPRFLFFVEPQRDSKYKVYSPPPAVVHEPSYAPVSPLRPAMKHNRQHQRRFGTNVSNVGAALGPLTHRRFSLTDAILSRVGLAPPNPAVVSQLLETSQAEGRTLSVPILPPNLLAMLPEPLQPYAPPYATHTHTHADATSLTKRDCACLQTGPPAVVRAAVAA